MKSKFFLLTTIVLIFSACQNSKTQSADTMIEKGKSLLFVGTYTDKEGHVDGQADGIYALEFDPETSSLSKTNLTIATTNPSYLYVDSENNKIYAVNEKVGAEEKVSAFTYNNEGIEFINSLPAYGGAPCHLTKIGDHIISANYVGGNHVVYEIGADGQLVDQTDNFRYEGKGLTNRQQSPHAHMIIQSPHTNEIIGTDLGTDAITIFDLEGGRLNKLYEVKLEPGSGPRHVDFHPTIDMIYVLNELNGTIDVLKKKDGTYEVIQNITSTKNPNNGDAGSGAIRMHPSGAYLFASNRGPFNTISQYKVADDGTLDLYGERSANGQAPRDFTFDPTGNYMLVANQNSDNIAIFIFNQDNGQLIDTGHDFAAPTPVCLKFE